MSIFQVYNKRPKRNFFDDKDLGFMNTMSIQDFGVLYPILAKELVPGDVFKHRHAQNLEFMPMSANVHHGFRLNTYYFFVPYRIIYPDWDKYYTQVKLSDGSSAGLQTPFVAPYVQARDLYNRGTNHQFWAHGSLSDYLGMNSFKEQAVSAVNPAWDTAHNMPLETLFHRAYQKIWVDHFIDTEVNADINTRTNLEQIFSSSGGENVNLFNYLFCFRSKCWSKDLFTTSLKNTRVAGVTPFVSGNISMDNLRELGSLNSWSELLMRAGSRTQDILHAIFGVSPADYRIDQAEFLQAESQPIIKGSVVSHNPTTIDPQTGAPASLEDQQGYRVATMSGAGVSRTFKYRAREFGVLMGLCCIEPDAVYFQGMQRQFLKTSPYDHYVPQFDSIGDQMTYNAELMTTVTSIATNDTNMQGFGFAPRYSEYKYYDNEIHGLIRDDAYLDFHDAKHFSSLPGRNSRQFSLIADPAFTNAIDYADLKRIFGFRNTFIAIAQFYHSFQALRPMSKGDYPHFKG